MNYREPEAMKEIHDIRLKVFEEEQGLSSQERAAKANDAAEKLLKQFGLNSKLLRRKERHAQHTSA